MLNCSLTNGINLIVDTRRGAGGRVPEGERSWRGEDGAAIFDLGRHKPCDVEGSGLETPCIVYLGMDQ